MPKVSVIIPVYGVEKYIERCARSLFEQTLDDIEYLFIDDCTPDKSIEVLKKVLEDYPNRKDQTIIHRMEKNSGQATVREWGMRNAKGEYVIHCDSDDWVNTFMYKEMYEKALMDNADCVICDFNMTNGANYCEVITGGSFESCTILYNDIMSQNYTWAVWNKLIARNVYQYNDIIYPQHSMGEDMALNSQILFYCKKISYINKPLYNYYYNPNSIMNTIDENRCYGNFLQLKANTKIAVDFINEKLPDVKIKQEIASCLTFNSGIPLLKIIKRGGYRKEWNKQIPSFFTIMFNPRIKLYYKLVYIATKFRLYPYK